MFKKFASGILLGLFALPAFGFMPTDDFEVIHTQTVGDTGGIEFLADIAGAVQVGKDYRPTSDTSSPLYKFKALTYFLQNGEKLSGHVASINIINCHDRTFFAGHGVVLCGQPCSTDRHTTPKRL